MPFADVAPPRLKNIQKLERQLADLFKCRGAPGMSVAIIENGQLTFAKGYGYGDIAGKIPAGVETPFYARSISKSITSIAVMTLLE